MSEGIETIMAYVTGPLIVPFFIVQFAIGAVTPILVLSYMFWRGTTGQVVLAEGDTFSIFLPMRRMFAEQVAAGKAQRRSVRRTAMARWRQSGHYALGFGRHLRR